MMRMTRMKGKIILWQNEQNDLMAK